MLRCHPQWPANADLARRIFVRIAKKTGRSGLAVVAGTGVHFAVPSRAIRQFDGNPCTHPGRIAGRPTQRDAHGFAAGNAVVPKGERIVVVSRDEKVGPAVVIEIEHDERFRVTRHHQTALGGRHRGEVALAIAAQHLAEAGRSGRSVAAVQSGRFHRPG